MLDQILRQDESYVKNAQSVYLNAVHHVDSILTALSIKKFNFTENDTAVLLPISSLNHYSAGIRQHAKRIEKNIKLSCYERVTNLDSYEKLTETEFNTKAQDFSKTIIANF